MLNLCNFNRHSALVLFNGYFYKHTRAISAWQLRARLLWTQILSLTTQQRDKRLPKTRVGLAPGTILLNIFYLHHLRTFYRPVLKVTVYFLFSRQPQPGSSNNPSPLKNFLLLVISHMKMLATDPSSSIESIIRSKVFDRS